MNDRQIRCFLEVCKELNFTKAAEKMYVAQPAVSRNISSLEKELGIKLFNRESRRKITLTEEGKTFYNMFLRFSAEFNDAVQSAHAELQPLRFGYNSGWDVSSFIPAVMEKCMERRPDFSVTIDCLNFADLSAALLKGDLDAILSLEDYNQNVPGLESDRVTEIPRFIFFSKSRYPRADSPKDFYNEDFFIVDDSQVRKITSQIEKYCAPYHFVPKLKTVPNIETVLARVENGLGVAILDGWTEGLEHSNIGRFEIGSKHPVSLVWREDSYTQEIRLFHRELLNQLNSTSEHTDQPK